MDLRGTIRAAGDGLPSNPLDRYRLAFLAGLVLFVVAVVVQIPLLIVPGIALGAWGLIMFQKAQEAVPNDMIVCKFCQSKGTVHTGIRQRKRGISGGKATGALMTGGASLFATGLSRKQNVTHLWCTSCGMEWDTE